MMPSSMWWQTDGQNKNRQFLGDADKFMKDLSLPNEMAVEFAIHRFMGDARDPFPRPQDHILCLSVKEDFWTSTNGSIGVTLLNDDVTCKECLELIHA